MKKQICYGCEYHGSYREGCGCIMDPNEPCLSIHAESNQHDWEDYYVSIYPESEPECVGKICLSCGAQEIS